MTDSIRPVRLILALVLLNVSVAFLNWWPTPAIRWTGLLSVELALTVIALSAVQAMFGTLARRTLNLLTGAWLLLVLGRYTQVTAPALWGRELNFYWDLQFVPDVAAMLAKVAHPLLVAFAVVLGLAFGAGLWVTVRWAFAEVARALSTQIARRRLTGSALLVASLFFLGLAAPVPLLAGMFAEPVVPSYLRQAQFVFDAWTGRRTLPASPSFAGDVDRLAGADVLLVFLESYGAVTFERPEFAAVLAEPRRELEAEIHRGQREVVSALVESPTFGGSSWFAHITLLSGIPVRDPQVNALLMTEQRETWPRAMTRHGYRTIALMPGLWTPWPEGAFYGFDEIYTGQRLDYHGPPFGWWSMTDQFSLAKFDELEFGRPNRRPLFLFFPTISTHTPFTPTPPYQPDWPRMLTDHPYDDSVMERVYDETVDWTNLGPSYARATRYAFETLTGYLSRHADDDFVMILIGDHQPPALVSGEGAPWDVPVHVIARNHAVLDRLRSRGFRDGLTPSRPSLGSMQSLLPLLLESFSGGSSGDGPGSDPGPSPP